MSGKKINGLSFVASPRKINDTIISHVQQVNANWVSLMPFAFMRDIDSPRIQYNSERQWRGERIEGIKETALAFKAKGIRVMLKPQIWAGHGSFTGHIEMKTEEDWKVLEQQYDAFILDFARAAEDTKCEMFCMGTELNKFVVNRPAYWDSLIIKIRMIYKGKITYAENWDTYINVPFWKKLDYIGVDAYFPLSDAANFTKQDLENAWEKHKKEIESLSLKNNSPILFTEYGYRSCDYAAKEPWTNDKHPVNLDNQKIALEGLFNSFWHKSWFAGGFLWKWYDNENAGGENNSDYTPQNKPSVKLIEDLYGQH
ncbi:MAG: glycoside hydrolase [Sphingobacteriales bacterium]|nr:glycoside hydrolase [Sphingobacteriales bacterium]